MTFNAFYFKFEFFLLLNHFLLFELFTKTSRIFLSVLNENCDKIITK